MTDVKLPGQRCSNCHEHLLPNDLRNRVVRNNRDHQQVIVQGNCPRCGKALRWFQEPPSRQEERRPEQQECPGCHAPIRSLKDLRNARRGEDTWHNLGTVEGNCGYCSTPLLFYEKRRRVRGVGF